jgi:hypothetical protein
VVMKSSVFWDVTLCLPPDLMLVSYLAYSSTLKMEGTCSSETSVGFQRTTWRDIPEDRALQNNSVSILTKLCAGRPRNWNSIPGRGKECFLLHSIQAGYWAQAVSYPMVLEAISSWVKRPAREADHSPPSNAEVKNTRTCALPFLVRFRADRSRVELVRGRVQWGHWYWRG